MSIETPEELERLQAAGRVVAEAIRAMRTHARPGVTTRELDVLTLVGKGLSNSEIADELFISGVTVKSHIGRIFVKLHLRDRSAAIVYAYDNGIVAPR